MAFGYRCRKVWNTHGEQLVNTTDKTLQYYDDNAYLYVERTIDAELFHLQNEFLSRIAEGGRILDLGCGTGRDAKAFLQQGFHVVAVDGSKEMCKLASEYIGQEVICSTFQEFDPDGMFDGIWACDSLLHLEPIEIFSVMRKLVASLNIGGSFYVSFKYGDSSGERDGRYFTDMNENSFYNLIRSVPELKIQREFITEDVHGDRAGGEWLNIFMIKRKATGENVAAFDDSNMLTEQTNTLNVRRKKDVIVDAPQGKRLTVHSGKENIDFNGVLARLSQYVDMGNVISHIEKTKEYVVQIPVQYQKQFESGEYFINKNNTTGVEWPTLMRKTENGQYRFVDDLPIKQKEFIQGNPMRDITQNFYNISMQRQIAALADVVQDTYKAVERIENGQMDDRIALLISGREQIIYALNTQDDNEKRRAISLARDNLITAKNQIGLTLKRRAEEFEKVPKSALFRFASEVRHSGYLREKDKEIYKLQDYYQLYLEATKLLAASYIITGDKSTAEQVFVVSADFMRNINFEAVKSIGYGNRKGEAEEMFYNQSAEYINAEHEQMMQDAREYEYLSINVSGAKLLEVFSDGRPETEKVSE